MKSFVYHFQTNVSDSKKSFPFYKDLLTYLGYKITYEASWGFGTSNGTADIWIVKTPAKYKKNIYHRKNTGLNHIAFGVSSEEEVKTFIKEFLEPRGIKPLYDSPREYPEYETGYFAVFFEDPDRIKLEVTYKHNFPKRLSSKGE